MADQIIISYAEAKKLNLTHYFTGKPCKRGHIERRCVARRMCAGCSREKAAGWRADNPDKAKEASQTYYNNNRVAFNKRVNARKVKQKLRAIAYKGGKCELCGYAGYYGAMAFHHPDPSEKEYSIGEICGCKWETIQKELDKCHLLCTRCHDEIHGGYAVLPDA